MLIVTGKRDGENLAPCSRLHQPDRWVLHGQFRTEIAIDPFHGRVFVGSGSLGHEVVDVLRPVLNGRIAAACAFLNDDLDHR